jgi:hypothetical protein
MQGDPKMKTKLRLIACALLLVSNVAGAQESWCDAPIVRLEKF